MGKISVIIPFYNNEHTIVETLDSVFKQTYTNFEVIIINDGSLETSVNALNQLKESYNITIYNQENSGPSVARNHGVKKANGDFILFLDADDVIDKTYLEKCINAFKKNPKLEIVYCKAQFFDGVNEYWDLPAFKLPHFLLNNSIFVTSLIKKQTFINVGMFDTKLTFTEDWELWIRIVKTYGEMCVYRIPEILFYYRKRQEKTSLTDHMNINNNAENSRLYIYNKHYSFYKNNGLGLEYLMNSIHENLVFKDRYYNIWYKKLFYFIKKKR